ncbi:MAG: hypothetical protein HRT88_00075 [Lentisphaeraceae bacterium]|nr:hypothetical protein [Lentisphaeraceae bacterium]
MPPLTIAFVNPDLSASVSDISSIQTYINENIGKGYILDGIQRLNTLDRIRDNENLNADLPVYINVIIAPTEDKLLYRMITLNNGQKPMTPRHQIEILTQELFDLSDLDIDIQTEKEKGKKAIKGSFSLGDISKAYLAFLTNEVNNENNKIIGEKMDQIIVGRIMDKKPENNEFDFKSTLMIINKLSQNDEAKRWLKLSNNLIGFCVGIKQSYKTLEKIDVEDFVDSIKLFDQAFHSINPSKVNLGKVRRLLSKAFIEDYVNCAEMDELELVEEFMELTS